MRTLIEYRLVRVRGEERQVFARGSERYVEDMFMFHAPHTPPVALAERFGNAPATWQVETVLVVEDVLRVRPKTAVEVEQAKRLAAQRIPAGLRMAEEQEAAE